MSLSCGGELLLVVMTILSPSLSYDLMHFVGNYLLFVELFAFYRHQFAFNRQKISTCNHLNIIKKQHVSLLILRGIYEK